VAIRLRGAPGVARFLYLLYLPEYQKPDHCLEALNWVVSWFDGLMIFVFFDSVWAHPLQLLF
jgi:hypothetical protein